MTTVFGKNLRGRRKPETEEEVAQIADEANLWWTRRDFVQNPVVRTRSTPGTARTTGATGPGTPHPAPAAEPAAVRDPTLDGRGFSEVFTTESLFGHDTTAARPAPAPAPASTPDPSARRRARLPLNHPLFPALLRLGLDAEAGWQDIQHAYRNLAKEAHPDRTGDNGEAMADLNAAYNALREARRYGVFGED